MEATTKTLTIQQILSDAGFDVSELNNRQRAVRSLNSVFKNSEVVIRIAPKGKVWTGSDDFKYNFQITLGKISTRCKLDSRCDFDTYTLLEKMGTFLRREEVKKIIYSETSEPCTCSKCEGNGIIPAFYYYADGVCFDCMGVGSIGKLMVQKVKKVSELTGRAYINKFYVSESYVKFPLEVQDIKPINFIGHATAEQWLSKKDDIFYIHQPVCMANSWYAIPESDFEKFTKEFNKVAKKDLI